MNILSVIHYPGFGGPYNSNIRIAPWLAEKGIHITMLIPDEPGDGKSRLEKAGMDIVSIPLHRIRATLDPSVHALFCLDFFREVSCIRKIIRDRRIDIVMINGLVNPHSAIAARLESAAVVWHLLDTRAGMLVRRAIMPLVLKMSDAIMSTGRKVAAEHPGAESFGNRLISFFPPVDTSGFIGDPVRRAKAREELQVPQDAFLVGTVGNVNPQKGYEYLIRAGALLKERIPELRIRVIGPFVPTHLEYQKNLMSEVRERGLSECIGFCGSHPRVERILPAFDVFVMTGVPFSEGITTAVLEAMSCGLPVVTTDAGAICEAVDDGVSGLIVPCLDSAGIAGAVNGLYANHERRVSMGRAARERALKYFDSKSCAETHALAFERALSHHGRRKQRAAIAGRHFPTLT